MNIILIEEGQQFEEYDRIMYELYGIDPDSPGAKEELEYAIDCNDRD